MEPSAADYRKVDTIFELREAVENKVHAETALAATGTEAARDALVVSQLDVDMKTQEAIDACQECGEEHAAGDDHAVAWRVGERRDNVIAVNFGALPKDD